MQAEVERWKYYSVMDGGKCCTAITVKIPVPEKERDIAGSKKFWSLLGNILPTLGIPPTFGEDSATDVSHERCAYCATHDQLPYFQIRRPRYFSQTNLDEFVRETESISKGRELFGYEDSLGYGPRSMKIGDTIWILEGHTTLFVLRSVNGPISRNPYAVSDTANTSGEDPRYEVVGKCYSYRPLMRLHTCPLCRFRSEDSLTSNAAKTGTLGWETIGLV
jgi:hypothetical protein